MKVILDNAQSGGPTISIVGDDGKVVKNVSPDSFPEKDGFVLYEDVPPSKPSNEEVDAELQNLGLMLGATRYNDRARILSIAEQLIGMVRVDLHSEEWAEAPDKA